VSISPLLARGRAYRWAIGSRNLEIGGAQVMTGVACGSCGTGLRANAKFCDECGAPTAVPSDLAEYKQVTVLFADIVHSMDIAAAVGAELRFVK
jgi:uncharacterized OB-fold protein